MTALGYPRGFFGLIAEGWEIEDTTGKGARGLCEQCSEQQAPRRRHSVVRIGFRKYAVAAVEIAAFGVVCFALVGVVFCQATLHVPRRLGRAPAGAETVSIVAEDKVRIADSRVGSGGFAPMFLNEGYAVLAPNSRAHGASGGRFVTFGLLEKYDAIAWSAWMKNAGCRKLSMDWGNRLARPS